MKTGLDGIAKGSFLQIRLKAGEEGRKAIPNFPWGWSLQSQRRCGDPGPLVPNVFIICQSLLSSEFNQHSDVVDR